MQFVDTDNFLGFHRLYDCKCSCVYILQRSTVAFVVCIFLRFLVWDATLWVGFLLAAVSVFPGLNMYPDVCVNSAAKCVYVLIWSSVCNVGSRVSYSVIMKGIGWRRQVFRMHGCICHIQINVNPDVNKWHFAWYVLKQSLIPPSCHSCISLSVSCQPQQPGMVKKGVVRLKLNICRNVYCRCLFW